MNIPTGQGREKYREEYRTGYQKDSLNPSFTHMRSGWDSRSCVSIDKQLGLYEVPQSVKNAIVTRSPRPSQIELKNH